MKRTGKEERETWQKRKRKPRDHAHESILGGRAIKIFKTKQPEVEGAFGAQGGRVGRRTEVEDNWRRSRRSYLNVVR